MRLPRTPRPEATAAPALAMGHTAAYADSWAAAGPRGLPGPPHGDSWNGVRRSDCNTGGSPSNATERG
eukprot:9221392-Lingulodinium_polyedra.AAC.1